MASVHPQRLPALVTTTAVGGGRCSVAGGDGGGGGSSGGSCDGGGAAARSDSRVGLLGGGGWAGDRRSLPGVGTYLIDGPKDSALPLRQRFLSFQQLHRGVTTAQDEPLPDIPFRLHPRATAMGPPGPASSHGSSRVDAATSPMPGQTPWDSTPHSLSGGLSPASSPVRSVTFALDHQEVTSRPREKEVTPRRTAKKEGGDEDINNNNHDDDDGRGGVEDVGGGDDAKLTSRTVANNNEGGGGGGGDLTSRSMMRGVGVVLSRPASRGPTLGSLARSVSFCQRPPRRAPPRPSRECTKARLGPFQQHQQPRPVTVGGEDSASNDNGAATDDGFFSSSQRGLHHHPDYAPRTALPLRPSQDRQGPGRSFLGSGGGGLRGRGAGGLQGDARGGSTPDLMALTPPGSAQSWRLSPLGAGRSVSMETVNWGHSGPTSLVCHPARAQSLLDLLRPATRGLDEGGEAGTADQAEEMGAALRALHHNQRLATLAFRHRRQGQQGSGVRPGSGAGVMAGSEFRLGSGGSGGSGEGEGVDEADRAWLERVGNRVVDCDLYDRFASRRKPATPSQPNGKAPYSPRAGVDFRLSHPAKGKVYPVFLNDGTPMRKFGRAAYKRKLSKAK